MAKFVKKHQFPERPVKNTGLTRTEYGDVSFTGIRSVTVPVGATADRPGTAANGMLRFNSSSNVLEYYDGTDWQTLRSQGNATVTKDNFTTTTGGTLYGPLSVTPPNEQSILVYMDNVIQEPGHNYTLSDSSGTLTGTLNYIKFDSPGTQNGKRLVVIHGFSTI